MYSNLPFTGAPFVYIALAVIFIVAGFAARLGSKLNTKKDLKQNKIETDN